VPTRLQLLKFSRAIVPLASNATAAANNIRKKRPLIIAFSMSRVATRSEPALMIVSRNHEIRLRLRRLWSRRRDKDQ